MPYEIIKDNGKFCVVKEGGLVNDALGCHSTRDEAEMQIVALNISENGAKSIDFEINPNDLTITDNYGIIEVEGYLFRYSNPQDKTDRDLYNQWWSKDTYLMQETFPVKGIPIMFGHSEHDEFTKVGIGIVNYATEDEIGLFIKGQLHNREKWQKIVEEVNRRRKMGLTSKQISDLADRAFNNMKSVVTDVPLQWSMGSYPPTYLADKKSGKIERAGIVEATLTPIPAEANGTQAFFNIKSIVNFLKFKESSTKEFSEDDNFDINNIYEILNNGDIQLAENKKEMPVEPEEKLSKEDRFKAIMDDTASKVLKMMMEGEEEETEKAVDIESPKDQAEMKSLIASELEKLTKRDSAYEKTDADNIKSLVENVLDKNVEDIVVNAVSSYIETKAEQTKKIKGATKSAFGKIAGNAPEASKSASGYIDPFSIKNYEVGLGDFFRDVFYGRTRNEGHTKSMKSQNPYIGTLGGMLTGQEMAQTILEPLRPEVVAFNAGVTQTQVNNIGIYSRPKMTTVPTAYRPGIGQQITETEAKYDTITAYLRPLAARVVVDRQMLLTTGTNMEEQLRREIIRSLRLQIDSEILQGVGTVSGTGNTGAQILGVRGTLLNSPVAADNVVTLATNGRKPKYDDLINAETQISEGNVELDQNTTAWIMHPRDRGTFRRTTDTNGQPLLYPNYSDRPYEDLIGYKVLTTTQIDNAQTTGTSNATSDIYFGNWRYGEYVLGNDIEVILDDMTLADQLQVRFIVFMYSDFIVHYPEAFYVMRGVTA